ncbi:MAG: cob(I)yrinic acid a,c-diamide adenosyltransferase [Clostridiales bacterium]|nr:cob(I)yrinic acid a,c-diamide adenosyltransferase [Clostridiales bacterium]
MKALNHVYYGAGKGKTTAALGLILRAAGCGIPCVLVQFLKDAKCGELESLEKLGVTVLRGKAPQAAFARDMTPGQLEETRRIHNDNLAKAAELSAGGGLLVLDELLDAVELSLVDENAVRELLENKPDDLELVLTGHSEVPWIFKKADYITEMVKRAHPFDRGIKGRRGVEF